MPSNTQLHELFASAAAPRGGIDVAAVIRRSKRRRLPAQVGVGSVVTLAVAGIGVASFNGIRPLTSSTVADADAGSESSSNELSPVSGGDSTFGNEESKRAPAERVNLCGGPLAEVAPAESGLELTTHFPDAAPAGQDVTGIVTLTNTGTKTITGTTAARPAITVSQDGVVLWHSNGPMIMLAVMVDLAPGESMDYEASFTPVRCEVEDDLAEGFRDGLPALAPGEYHVGAMIDLQHNAAPVELITGPAATITLR